MMNFLLCASSRSMANSAVVGQAPPMLLICRWMNIFADGTGLGNEPHQVWPSFHCGHYISRRHTVMESTESQHNGSYSVYFQATCASLPIPVRILEGISQTGWQALDLWESGIRAAAVSSSRTESHWYLPCRFHLCSKAIGKTLQAPAQPVFVDS
jgi:hypothetical protein